MAGRKNDTGQSRYQAAQVFNERSMAYDSWFTDSMVYRIELAALQSLNSLLPEPKLENCSEEGACPG